MKIIKELPIDGMVCITLDRRWANGNYGEKNWKGLDRISSDTEVLRDEVYRVMKFVEQYDKKDEDDEDAPTASYYEIDAKVEHAYVIRDGDQVPKSWRQEHTYEHLHEAIEKVIGDMPCRGTYCIKRDKMYNEHHDDFKYVVESVYKNPICKIDGLNQEEERYIDNLKQYLILIELSK